MSQYIAQRTIVVTEALFDAYHALRKAALNQPQPTKALRDALASCPRSGAAQSEPWPPHEKRSQFGGERGHG